MNIDSNKSLPNLVRERHLQAFELCEDVLKAIQPAISKPRKPSHPVPRALELLMRQAHNTLVSIHTISLQSLSEDAATLTRRLLEIAITVAYIVNGASSADRSNRAGCYLTRLWEDMPDDLRKTLSVQEQKRWKSFVRRHRKRFTHKDRCRFPRFIEMFKDINQGQTYEADYRLLSSIAHGSPFSIIHVHASRPVPMRDDTQTSIMLVFSCRYYLAVADTWIRGLRLMPGSTLKPIIRRVLEFFENEP
jgi:hypothetical protein